MDAVDLFWNLSQDKAIGEILASQTRSLGRSAAKLQGLQDENRELRIRIGVLIRLLIERGVFSADDFAKLVNEIKERLDVKSKLPRVSARGPAKPKGR